MTRGTDILIDVSAKRAEKHVRLMSRLTGTVSALVMIAAAIVALILTNVGFHEPLHHAMETPLGFYIGETFVGLTFEQVVNDLFMAFFFLLVGCELKYEMTVGALAKPKQAILPMVAALGGVCGPALIYLAINMGGDAVQGWAIPTATDIAFALAVMSLFGERIPVGVKVFFSTLAIADDMVAIVVIALFYSTDIAALWLVLAALAVMVLIVLNRLHVFKLTPYLLLGAFLWVCFFNAGIHATLAGVVLAFTLPVKSNVNLKAYAHWIAGKSAEFDRTYDSDLRILGQHEVTELTHEVERVSHIVTPPLQRLEHAITFPVNYLILPLFAFVNAQVFVADACHPWCLGGPCPGQADRDPAHDVCHGQVLRFLASQERDVGPHARHRHACRYRFHHGNPRGRPGLHRSHLHHERQGGYLAGHLYGCGRWPGLPGTLPQAP